MAHHAQSRTTRGHPIDAGASHADLDCAAAEAPARAIYNDPTVVKVGDVAARWTTPYAKSCRWSLYRLSSRPLASRLPCGYLTDMVARTKPHDRRRRPRREPAWEVIRFKGSPRALLGVVYASDEKAALKAAIDQLNIPPGQRDQLLIRRQA